MARETEHEKLIRHLRRVPLEQIRNEYFSIRWTSYGELMGWFKKQGWTRGELVKADRPTGRGEERWSKRILYWYLQGFPDTSLQPTDEEIANLEQQVSGYVPCIVVTAHGPYESEVLYNPTWKKMLRCVRESIYVNGDPDHRGVNLPTVETYHDGGPNQDITYHVICFSMDS